MIWEDSYKEECPTTTNLAAVSEETESLVTETYTKRFQNCVLLQTRNPFPLPQVAATRAPQLDSFIKLEISQPVMTIDKELAKIQTFVLDAFGFSHFSAGERCQGDTITHNVVLDATKTVT